MRLKKSLHLFIVLLSSAFVLKNLSTERNETHFFPNKTFCIVKMVPGLNRFNLFNGFNFTQAYISFSMESCSGNITQPFPILKI